MLAIVSKTRGRPLFLQFWRQPKKDPAEAALQRRASSGGGHARRIEWIQGVLRATKARCAPSTWLTAPQPARASSSSSTSSNIYKPRVPFVDLYEVLALEPSATDGEVKTAYRILQKAVHPDLAGEYASAAAALVNEAASVLTSPRTELVSTATGASGLPAGGVRATSR